jgi:hypothetical protein
MTRNSLQRFPVSRELCTIVIYCRNHARALKILNELLDGSKPPAGRVQSGVLPLAR